MFSKLTGGEDQGQTRWQRAGRRNVQGGDEDGAHVGRDGGGVGDDGDGGGEYSGEHAVEMRRVAHMMAKMGVVAAVVTISVR